MSLVHIMARVKQHFAVVLFLMLALPASACRQDAQVDGAIAEIGNFTAEIVRRVESAEDPLTGVDDARSYFESRKAALGANLAELKRIPSDRVSSDAKQRLAAALSNDASRVARLRIELRRTAASNRDRTEKLDKLVKDYQAWLAE